jgi:hypothetical protein
VGSAAGRDLVSMDIGFNGDDQVDSQTDNVHIPSPSTYPDRRLIGVLASVFF